MNTEKRIDKRLAELGLRLPEPPPPGGIYVPFRQTGNLVYTAGNGPTIGGLPQWKGKLGAGVSIEQGQEAARLCVLNILAGLRVFLGDLDRVQRIIKVLGFIASTADFHRQPEVLNGASSLLIGIFGEAGKHARSAIGTNVLPGDIPVEIELILEVSV